MIPCAVPLRDVIHQDAILDRISAIHERGPRHIGCDDVDEAQVVLEREDHRPEAAQPEGPQDQYRLNPPRELGQPRAEGRGDAHEEGDDEVHSLDLQVASRLGLGLGLGLGFGLGLGR